MPMLCRDCPDCGTRGSRALGQPERYCTFTGAQVLVDIGPPEDVLEAMANQTRESPTIRERGDDDDGRALCPLHLFPGEAIPARLLPLIQGVLHIVEKRGRLEDLLDRYAEPTRSALRELAAQWKPRSLSDIREKQQDREYRRRKRLAREAAATG